MVFTVGARWRAKNIAEEVGSSIIAP